MEYKSCGECDWDATGSSADVARAYKAHRLTHRQADEAEDAAESTDAGA
jgi:hypothetical protein